MRLIAPILTLLFVASFPARTAGVIDDRGFQDRGSKDRFAEIFNRGVELQRTLHSIRAHFTETTVSTLLARPLIAHGTIVAATPARVLMTYTDPERKIVAIDTRSLRVEWPDRREQEKIDIGETQKRIDQYFTHANVDELRSMFTIVAQPDNAVKNTDHIELLPKRKQIKQGLERLELWINHDSSLLTQLRMTFAGGDLKTIALDDIAVNVPISEDLFRVTK
jgi:outer membrane lipoprotein-sorting protein